MTDAPKIFPVILCGGSGTRLWPLSRMGFPKQFLGLTHAESLLQQTVRRVSGAGFHHPVIVGGVDHRFMIADHLLRLGIRPERIILEPVARNTAAAVALAAHEIAKIDPAGLMLVLPSDHVIVDENEFLKTVQTAARVAVQGGLVTFGIEPSGPETGYGYILRGAAHADVAGAFKVDRFVEKPRADVARQLIDQGNCSWNGGIFLFRADVYMDELKNFEPDIHAAAVEAADTATGDLDFLRPSAEIFSRAPNISIDYAVMERTKKIYVTPVSKIGWNDVGSFKALWEVGEKDDSGNVTVGDVVTEDVGNSYIHADEKMVAALGVDNLVIVQTDDVFFVTSMDRAQDVKTMVEKLIVQKRDQAQQHATVHRPWGTYRGVDKGERYQVKRIVVRPGHKLSAQYHHHRAEHWIVVSGTAKVTCDDKVMLLQENQSTYIPLGSQHRLENPGKVDLELIEVQSGSYLGEDDIVRIEDVYGRAAE